MAELLKDFEPEIESFTLVPSDGGRFELTVNGRLLYSKLDTRRHVEPGELSDLVKHFMEGAK
jgi:selenoprotein W-related protein